MTKIDQIKGNVLPLYKNLFRAVDIYLTKCYKNSRPEMFKSKILKQSIL
jgi:hypothetical protein